jgi:hypothetical protein
MALAGLPALLAACGGDETAPATSDGAAPVTEEVEGNPIVKDVLDFALASDDWEGDFGWVKLRLHSGVFDGADVFFIRTDSSDRQFALDNGLVWAPKIGELLARGLVGKMYVVEGDSQPTILSTEPGRDDYTPAWRVFTVAPGDASAKLRSEADVLRAEKAGEITVRQTRAVVNAPILKWSSGELPVDGELKEYLGGGQLIEPPDTEQLEVTYKLHECFPQSWYIVEDTSLAPMAEGMQVAHSPRLSDAPRARATGRTNVFMNGMKGPGPMGFQPSVFDSAAGAEEWSPYWEHFTYAWKQEGEAEVISSQDDIHAARDEGTLDEFPGTPDTGGETFTVNCPVPVLAPNTFRA